jgi:hypothetical protein
MSFAATVLRAASFRALRPRLFDSVILAELIEAVKNQYNFRQVPTIQEVAEKPASFTFGETKRGGHPIIIEQLTVSYVGVQATSVAASTRTSTDDSDSFLDELIKWVGRRYRLDTNPVFAPSYHSLLEVVFDAPISQRFTELRSIGQMVTSYMHDYGLEKCPEFELEGFSMHFEPTPALVPSPLAFSVQRRVGAAYAENKYFSQAPLRTRDHEELLRHLNRILSS